MIIAALLVAMAAGPDSLDRYVVAEMARRHIPGLAIAIARDDSIIRTGYYGYADLERRTPVTRTTSFAIALMSKAFTDAAILLLADQGRLKLDDPVTRYLPPVPSVPSAWSRITLRQLMNHTAGLVDDWDHDWDEIPGYFLVNQSDSAFLAALYGTPLVFPPGTRMEYGAGPFVLGVVVARVSGQSYAAFLRQRIFESLGLTGTYVNDPYAVRPDRAAGYLWWKEAAAKPWPWLPAGSPGRGELTHGLRVSPAAEARGDVGVSSTAEDLIHWVRGLLDYRLLSHESTDAMFGTTRMPNGDIEDGGFGWFKDPDRTGSVLAHGGNFRTGYSSMMAYHPKSRITVVVLSNLADAVSDESLVEGVMAFIDPDHAPISKRPILAQGPPELSRIAAAMRAVAAGRTDSTVMVDRFPQFYYGKAARAQQVADSLTSLGCDDARKLDAAVQGYPTTLTCYYRLNRAAPAYAWASIAAYGRVSYMGPPVLH